MSTAYERRKERERERQAAQSREGRDIAPIPEIGKRKKDRDAVKKSLRLFCEKVLPERFKKKWSADHLKAIAKIERAVVEGDVFALAMPRGSGKTTLVVAAVLWAILNGYRRYVVLIGSDRDAAAKLLAGIKVELEMNDELLALYPEAVYPIRKLEGKANKATGQLCGGERTYIEWKGPRIVFATVPGSICSGAVIETYGILGRIRGAQFTRADGQLARPDFFLLDDPQTDRSAASRSQISRRLNLITGAVLGLAGPGEAISGCATVTVIEPDDVADQLLNPDLYPDWAGERFQLIYQWPSTDRAKDLWEEYATIRAEDKRKGLGLARATAFYKSHQRDMDADSRVAWDERYDVRAGELSALQHAYNLKFSRPLTFDAEYQNKPRPPQSDVVFLSVDEIERKCSGYARGVLNPILDTVTAFIDVQGELLYYLVLGVQSATFTTQVLEYGTWPEQVSKYFTLRNVSKPLSRVYPGLGLEGKLRKGLWDLVSHLSSRKYSTRDNQISHKIDLIGIDANWKPSRASVLAVADEHPRSAWILPCYGKYIGPESAPIDEWKIKDGERLGAWWILRPRVGGGRSCLVDTNSAKSFTNARLNVAIGDSGALSLYQPALVTEHRMPAEHARAETPKTKSIDGGRSVEIWESPPSKPDNHLWDCLVGCHTLASIKGATLAELAPTKNTRARAARRPKLRLKR